MRFIVIRHAESQWNREGIIQGQLDSPVTHHGQRQIAALMVALKDTPFSQIFSSPSGRAMTTAQALATLNQCTVSSDARLHERHFGCLQGLPYHQAMRSHRELTSRIFAGEPTASAPEGESAHDVAQRMSAFFLSFPPSLRGTFGVVTHGHALQALIWQLQGGDWMDDTSRYDHPNCSYSVIEVGNGRLQLQNWGVATHLRALHPAPI
ncbi:putative phosphoglycerate mutase [Serratia fonticola]|uniref:Putative phosphoglycerate mutase n=1 Tax=Serratia fonticola TaxID=47917 RepID=A0A559T411_SERFO|nr:histidine phosphatase family protein [Serratia fonticola]TQI78157.1 putative phosphoglycerate mutase [Serratia fonticola]TQI94845.1 putative phosphoglycerate mutase [Serratia fonticola]TVZ69343.1 putative phosphoglycerate mutase [Serratia fonticola]